ncbi:MAG: Aspartyl/glutamyl-tRNA(Asn/Gln) amidotransferase subunit [Candidatus Saccharibacteria bacterium]|nr:Aspartyl/glutamyl-tRNA(Asn/Gln) amidotransferase subunit [Candidatus Saccharibacteria bacterium]
MTKYIMTIGIECHVQLLTATKLFSGADNDARDKEPNSVVSPIDYGLPGMLPILNREAVNLAVKAGKALNAKIANVSRFDRKHYFYPDLPNGYQITQMYHPTILAGAIDAPLEDGTSVKVRIHHAHIESDAGKLTHYGDYSLVDLNRAGTPLIEIVSEPDMHSPQEAKAYAAELHKLMIYAGVTRGDLYHGNMRFDVNLSVAPEGATELGKRAEVKNLNSFKSVEKAAEYEYKRQVALLEKGERVVQETRGWDDATQKTSSQRSKEDAQDYRYMPDADIPPVILSDVEISKIQTEVPELPPYYRSVWTEAGFNKDIQDALLLSQSSAQLVEQIRVKSNTSIAKRVGFWFLKAVSQETDSQEVEQQISEEFLIDLATMVEDGTLNSNAGDTIFFEMKKSSESPKAIAERLNLIQVSDENEIAKIVDEVLADPASAKAIEDIKAGNDKVIGFLVGQIMKKSQGKANPALAQKLIRERL